MAYRPRAPKNDFPIQRAFTLLTGLKLPPEFPATVPEAYLIALGIASTWLEDVEDEVGLWEAVEHGRVLEEAGIVSQRDVDEMTHYVCCRLMCWRSTTLAIREWESGQRR